MHCKTIDSCSYARPPLEYLQEVKTPFLVLRSAGHFNARLLLDPLKHLPPAGLCERDGGRRVHNSTAAGRGAGLV
jgi:hypothetical protein